MDGKKRSLVLFSILIIMNSYLLHLFVISFLFIHNVLAYGYVGHQITTAIAQRFLTPKARKNVQQLLPKGAKGDLSL